MPDVEDIEALLDQVGEPYASLTYDGSVLVCTGMDPDSFTARVEIEAGTSVRLALNLLLASRDECCYA